MKAALRRFFFDYWLSHKMAEPSADKRGTVAESVSDIEWETVKYLAPELSIFHVSAVTGRRLQLQADGWAPPWHFQAYLDGLAVNMNTQEWWDG